MAWPPQLSELKTDMGVTDDRDDDTLTTCLNAAVVFVERVRATSFNFDEDPESDLPAPTAEIELGTLRLAGRWFTRRKSPAALIEMGEFGAARVPTFDPDIERLLGVGRYRGPVIA